MLGNNVEGRISAHAAHVLGGISMGSMSMGWAFGLERNSHLLFGESWDGAVCWGVG